MSLFGWAPADLISMVLGCQVLERMSFYFSILVFRNSDGDEQYKYQDGLFSDCSPAKMLRFHPPKCKLYRLLSFCVIFLLNITPCPHKRLLAAAASLPYLRLRKHTSQLSPKIVS